MLDSNIQTQLKSYFEKIQHPVEMVATLNASPKSNEMLELLRELTQLTDKISLKENGSAAHAPSFTVGKPGEVARISFAGIPMGHEMTSLILALLQTGGHPAKTEQAVIDQIKGLSGPLRFETFISLSCHNCPDVVQALNLMAVLNPQIEHEMIDGALFQDEVNERHVMAVPMVFLNGELFGQGRMTVEEIAAKLDTGSSERDAAVINAKEGFDSLIIGGGQVADTVGIENFISVKETEGPKLVMALEQHVKSYDVDVMNLQKAVALAKSGDEIEITLANGASLKSKTVILSTGARWREMNVPGEQEYRGKGVAYCPHCDGPLYKGKRVAVIGGGNSGVEAAIDLAGIVSHVTLIEFDTKLRADAVLQKKLYSLSNVTVILNALSKEVLGAAGKVTTLRYEDRATNEMHNIALEGIFVQIGLLPNTDWLKGVIELSPRGEVIVDDRGQTSMPGVFAAGDCTTVPYKQIIIAMGEGAKASLGAFDHLIRSSVA